MRSSNGGARRIEARARTGEYLIKILITPAGNGASPSTDSHDAVYKIVNIIIYISVTRDR